MGQRNDIKGMKIPASFFEREHKNGSDIIYLAFKRIQKIFFSGKREEFLQMPKKSV